MTTETLVLVAGVILSLLFSYIPGLNVKFAALGSEVKRLIMLVLVVLVGGVAFLLSCTGLGEGLGIVIACTQGGALTLIQAIVLAAIGNQTAYMLSPETKAVVRAKEERVEG